MAQRKEIMVNGQLTPVWQTDSTAQQIDDTVKTTRYQCNPNLLDNWCFLPGCVVNQRGQTSYSGNAHSIDRWFLTGGISTATIGSDGITLNSTTKGGAFQQGFENKLPVGQTYTLSALMRANSANCGIQYIFDDGTVSQSAVIAGTGGLELVTLTYTPAATIKNVRARAWIEGATFTVLAAKLELGDQQTLAHQDADGNWVLNEIPNYAEQLARCQRYLMRFGAPDAYAHLGAGIVRTATAASISVVVPVPMRAMPAVSITGAVTIRQAGDRYDISTAALVDVFSQNTLMLNLTAADLGSNAACEAFLVSDNYITFSAEL